ncbi:hypothetical protein PAXRUDRAFT_443244 [Paxillus rubicundulus Ve08.2h10]|uniref:Uncharacterized protein n=1 Tax=Paxillus rubicundulus Ve08.2h10 TaxID=930991 RepID=A0A0D0E222_9AGAM|nr:hypothetical protein PAXRUDRAFT_443244 [Paxillus rubicundulus Ve08.2h10]
MPVLMERDPIRIQTRHFFCCFSVWILCPPKAFGECTHGRLIYSFSTNVPFIFNVISMIHTEIFHHFRFSVHFEDDQVPSLTMGDPGQEL